MGSIAEFVDSYILGGISLLVTTCFLMLQPILLMRRHESPTSMAVLANEFDVYTFMDWSRGLVGFLCGLGAFTEARQPLMWPAVPPLLITGCFLLSPLSDKVFTYSIPPFKGNSKRRPWTLRNTGLWFLRSTGLLFVTGGILSFPEKEKFAASMVLIAIGLALVFIRQLKKLFLGNRKPVVPVKPAIPEGHPVPAARLEPVAVQVPEATTSNADTLANLSDMYKNLRWAEPAQKGTAYVEFLNSLFSSQGTLVSNAFTLDGAGISGSFEVEGQIYILYANWQPVQIGEDALLMFNAKVESRSTWARGIFISDAGFTAEGLAMFAKGKRTSIIGMDGSDLQLVLAGRLSLVDAIRQKARRAVETNYFFVPLQELI
ncbi:hypothetical protein [Longitalea luteola]|uniref:hypothetical protein n=1 Tax=Longitalea luteola TaxID=2812563 RepID=UPI001A95783A|nr:hypothetical protein [Longitalea luteola]